MIIKSIKPKDLKQAILLNHAKKAARSFQLVVMKLLE